MIGFWAPFPNMWFVSGANVGRSGRLLSGFETAIIYVIQIFAAVGLWFRRKQLAVWFLASVTALSLTAMGLIVANISIIYRLRYAFMMLIIVLATDGAFQLLSRLRSVNTSPRSAVGTSTNAPIAF
jgi:hypothetical protein